MSALISKPGITNASTLAIPKQWDPTWFRNFINTQLTGADVRNAVGINGINVVGTLASPYATIGLKPPVTISSSSSPTATDLILQGSDYQLTLYAPSASLDQKYWFIRNANGTFAITALNDALSNGQNAYLIQRTGSGAFNITDHWWALTNNEMHLNSTGLQINGAATANYVPTYFGGQPGVVTADSQNKSFHAYMRFDTSVFGTSLALMKSQSNTVGTSAGVGAGTSVGDIVFLAADGSNGWPIVTRLIGIAENNVTAGAIQGALQIFCGVGSAAVEIGRFSGKDSTLYILSANGPTFTTEPLSGNNRAAIQLNGNTDAIITFHTGATLNGYVYGVANELRLLSSNQLTGYVNGGTLMYVWDASSRLSTRGSSVSPTGTTHAIAASFTGLNTEYGLVLNATSGVSVNATHYITFGESGTQAGTITAGATAASVLYSSGSDYRLKTNVVTLDPNAGMAMISKLRPVSFNWIADNYADIGFIAHEVQAVVPQAVSGFKDAVNPDGSILPQGVDLSKLIPWIVAALQTHDSKISALQTKTAAMPATPVPTTP